MIPKFLHRHGRSCSLCVALLFTFAVWVASFAYTQTHAGSIEKPEPVATATTESGNTQGFRRLSEALEKAQIEGDTTPKPQPTQTQQPTPETHPHHFQPPIEPEFIPEDGEEDAFHIV